MKKFAPYWRVAAGFFAAVGTWVVVLDLVHGRFGDVLVGVLLAAGLWYLAVGKPIRDSLGRKKAEDAALAARAQAGHEAFLAGDPAAFAPPPPAPEKRPVRRGVIIAAAVAAILVLIGIIGDISDGLDDDSDSEPTTTSAAATAAFGAPAPSTVRPTSAGAAVAQSVHSAVPTTTVAAASAATAPATMPNVVCMNLQDAQDTIQAAGVFYSRSQDATGEGRNQVIDRNWVVVGQAPPAGSTVGEGEAMLSVVKVGEPGDCS
ncbi:PASTA domain-containing protein [Rhodococcus sp. NPDC003322]